MSIREQRKAQTRATVLRAARDLFIEKGFEKTTIREIASSAGVGVGSVHVHFNDKQTLLLACFRDQIEGAVVQGLETLDRASSLPDQLTHLGRTLYMAYAQHPKLSQQMFSASLFLGDADPTEDLLAHFLGELVALFQAAHERGEIRRLPQGGQLAARGFFSSYITALIGGLAGRYGPPDAPDAAERWAEGLRTLLSLQLVGLGAEEAVFHEEES